MEIPHNVPELIQYAFYGLISLLAMIGLRQANQFNKQMEHMVTSVESLNLKVAIVIERSAQHEKLLDKHDGRISKLESD